MANTRNAAKAKRLMTKNGNGLTDTTRNTRQGEGAKTTQHDYESKPSPPYYMRFTRLSLQVKCK